MLKMTRDEMIEKLKQLGYENMYDAELESMDTEDIACELITREMEEEYYKQVRKNHITTKGQLMEFLDDELKNLKGVTFDNVKEFRELIKYSSLPEPLPDYWAYTLDFTDQCYKLRLSKFDVYVLPCVDDGVGYQELASGFYVNYTLISYNGVHRK